MEMGSSCQLSKPDAADIVTQKLMSPQADRQVKIPALILYLKGLPVIWNRTKAVSFAYECRGLLNSVLILDRTDGGGGEKQNEAASRVTK
jgi:hypothetical protein